MSVTSSALTFCSISSPTPERRWSALANWSGRTLNVSVVCARPRVEVCWAKVKPPTLSMIDVASAAAAETSIASTEIQAV